MLPPPPAAMLPEQALLHRLKQSHPAELLEVLAEMESQPKRLQSPEEGLLFLKAGDQRVDDSLYSRKYTNPGAFLSQSPYNDIMPFNKPRIRLPAEMELIFSALDKVGMNAISAFEAKEATTPTSVQKASWDEGRIPQQSQQQQQLNGLALNMEPPAGRTQIPTTSAFRPRDFDTSIRGTKLEEGMMDIEFCHGWWFGQESSANSAVLERPRARGSASSGSLPRSSSPAVAVAAPPAKTGTGRRDSNKRGTVFLPEDEQQQPTSETAMDLQSVKFMITEGQARAADGEEEEGAAAAVGPTQGRRKRPNTHKKGQSPSPEAKHMKARRSAPSAARGARAPSARTRSGRTGAASSRRSHNSVSFVNSNNRSRGSTKTPRGV